MTARPFVGLTISSRSGLSISTNGTSFVNWLKSTDAPEEEAALREVAAEAEVVGHVVDRRRDLVVRAAVEGRVLVAVARLAGVAGVQHQALADRDLEAGAAGLAHVAQVERGQAQVDVVLDRVEARDGRVGRSRCRCRRGSRAVGGTHGTYTFWSASRIESGSAEDARRGLGIGRSRRVGLPVGVLVPGEVEQEPALLPEDAAQELVVVADVDRLRVEEVLLVAPGVGGAGDEHALGNLLVLLELRGVALRVVDLARERERALLALEEAVLLLLGPPLGRGGKRERDEDRGEGERANDVLLMVMAVLLALPEEPVARRVDRPVDRRVAVQAALVEGVPRLGGVGRAGVARGLVALLAQQRRLHLQHLLVDRAVGVVAVEAVLAHRRVLPQERAALLGVAGVAVLVDRGLQQHPLVGRAVRVVAARALQLALAQRHVARAHQLGLLLQVAARAQLHLRLLEQRLLDGALGVRVVARAAGHLAAVVARAHPVLLVALVVAFHADAGGLDGAQCSGSVRIFVLSPAFSTWAWPGPWQPSQPSGDAMCGVALNFVHDLFVALDAHVHADEPRGAARRV